VSASEEAEKGLFHVPAWLKSHFNPSEDCCTPPAEDSGTANVEVVDDVRHVSEQQLKLSATQRFFTYIPPPTTQLRGTALLVFTVLWIAWGTLTNYQQKLNALGAATLFAAVELACRFNMSHL
jgi:hypothetical protein